MTAYVECIGSYAMGPRRELTESDLREIGEFTRLNVGNWLDRHVNPITWEGDYWVDFHAVCGEVEIPWDTEAAKIAWESAEKWKQRELDALPRGYCERCGQIVPVRIVQDTGPTFAICAQCGMRTGAPRKAS